MSSGVQTGTITTRVPARLDRLPWSRFHWLVVIGLGTVWILDGLEVTIVGSIAARLTEKGSGIELSAGQIGTAAAIYVAGACLGALFFGQLTDRLGRKKLFIVTLGVYIVATVSTAFAFSALFFYAARFVTGTGIGGEYAAINSAIDELIPARVRGRVDLMINGSYWVGSALGSALAILLLNTAILPKDIGWRVSFAIGAVLGLTIMLVRRNVPESPRWLFIHGREEEAEAIVGSIEEGIEQETGEELPEAERSITVRQREAIPFRSIGHTAFKLYPKRAVLGLSLFVGQAFIYNGVTFDLGTLYSTFYKVCSSFVPVFIIIFAVGNFLGPMTLGRLFDTVGRKPMISSTYLGSALVTAVMAFLFAGKTLDNEWLFEAFIFVAFFLASAGASAAYLTVSEIFPMETRALAIAFFYAIGTAVGGISGPLIFGHLIDSGSRGKVAIAFWIGAAVMALGGVVELFYGVKAEGAQLEDIAKPLTAADAEGEVPLGDGDQPAAAAGESLRPERREALSCRQRAEEVRARAAEHRAAAHELRPTADGGEERAADRLRAEEVLAQMADLHAQALDERAASHEQRDTAEQAQDDAGREAALERAGAAEERARGFEERAEALAAEHDEDAERHEALAEAATERARAREQRASAEHERGRAGAKEDEPAAEVARARAEMHERWAEMHETRARGHELRADGDGKGSEAEEQRGGELEQLALAAEERVHAAEHLQHAQEARGEREAGEETAREREQAAERERRARELERRVQERIARRRAREREGLRRFRPGPGSSIYAPFMAGLSGAAADSGEDLDREIEVIARALDEHGATDRDDLARLVGARYWGPGRFRGALREALDEGRARRVSRSTYAPPEDGSRES